MRRILQIAIATSATFALVAIGVCALRGAALLEDLRQHVTEVTLPAADATIHSFDTTAKAATAAVNASAGVMTQAAAVSKNLNRRITDTSENLNAILLQAGLAADQLQEASREQKKYFEHISADTDSTLKALNLGANSLNTNMEDVHKLLGDPHLLDAFAQADGVLADAHAMTTDAKGTVKRYTKPPTRKQRIIQDAKETGGLTYLVLKILASLP